VYNAALEFIEWISSLADVFLLTGNHDMRNASAYSSDLHFLRAFRHIQNVTVIDRPQYVLLGKTHTALMSNYMPPGKFIEWYNSRNTIKPDVVFTHQEFLGVKMGPISSSHGDAWPLDYPPVYNGHIHDFEETQPNLINVGTPCFTGYGEAGARYLVLINIDDNEDGTTSVSHTKHILNMPRKRTIACSTSIPDGIGVLHPKDLLRLVVTDTEDAIEVFKKTNKYKELKDHPNIKLVLKPVMSRKIQKNQSLLKFDQLLTDKASREGVLDHLQEMLRAFSS
jgi:DNA repair exonuclease SbcCD nuclease subunit